VSIRIPVTTLANRYPVVPNTAQSAGNCSCAAMIFSATTYSGRAGGCPSTAVAAPGAPTSCA
jgi:hypothetical protein